MGSAKQLLFFVISRTHLFHFFRLSFSPKETLSTTFSFFSTTQWLPIIP